MNNTYLAIDIGGTFTKYAVMDGNANILSRGKVPTEKESAEDFLGMIEGIYREHGKETDGIAVSSAGVIASSRGFMKNAGSIGCVQNLAFAEEMERRTGVPVTVENDARAAALAELWKGSLKECRNAAVLVIGTAVGGAVILNGNILHGRNEMAGEFSYLLTDARDPGDPEKTLAMSAGMPALIKSCAKASGIPAEKLSGELIFEKANAGEESYAGCVRQFARILASEIMNLNFIFDPERIAIGGGVSAQPLLIAEIREEIEKISHVYPHEVPLPEVTACRFFNDSNLIGALYVLRKKLEVQETKIA